MSSPTSHPITAQSSNRTLAPLDTDPDPDAIDLEANEPEKALERLYSPKPFGSRPASPSPASPATTAAAAAGAPSAEDEKKADPFLVTLEGRQHLNPHTWSVPYRWFLTVFTGVLVLNCSASPSTLVATLHGALEVG